MCKCQYTKQVCDTLLHPGPPRHCAENRHMRVWERSQGTDHRTQSLERVWDSVIIALGSLKQEDPYMFEANLVYIASSRTPTPVQ